MLMFQTTGSAAGVWSVLIVPVHRRCSRLADSEEDTRWTVDSHRALLQVCFVAYKEGPEFIFVASAFSSSFKFSETTSFLLLVLFCL
jgi:hypothetical protein